MIERARRVLVFAGYHRPQKSRFSWKDDAAGTVTIRYTQVSDGSVYFSIDFSFHPTEGPFSSSNSPLLSWPYPPGIVCLELTPRHSVYPLGSGNIGPRGFPR